MMNYKEGINHVKTFVFDVDGVLTDGDVYFIADEAVRKLNSRDGYAMQYAIKQGYQIFVITGGYSESLKRRLEELGVTEVFLRSHNKLDVFSKMCKDYEVDPKTCLYMGDDIPDLDVMKEVLVATCPYDAAVEVKQAVNYVSPFKGGRHAVRDVIEQTMRNQGTWMKEGAVNW